MAKTPKNKPALAAVPQPAIVVEPEQHETALAPIAPMSVLQRAVADGASVDVLERLLALQERWEATQARKAYDAAMAELRGALPSIVKNRLVDFTSPKGRTRYAYEDLATVTELVSPALARVGLSFRWSTDTTGPTVRVTCIVSHASGHSESTTLSCQVDNSGNKNDIQALGSAVTYLQRYTLKAALGLAASADTDGAKPKRTPEPAATHDGLDKPISEAARKRLWAIAKTHNRTAVEIADFLHERYNLGDTKSILVRDYDDIVDAISQPGSLVPVAREVGEEG